MSLHDIPDFFIEQLFFIFIQMLSTGSFGGRASGEFLCPKTQLYTVHKKKVTINFR